MTVNEFYYFALDRALLSNRFGLKLFYEVFFLDLVYLFIKNFLKALSEDC